jgi:hypothetical protein
LAKGWLRRAENNNDEQMAEQRRTTFNIVKQELAEDIIRLYKREFIQTYLRRHYGYQARENNVRDALRKLNKKGNTARKPSLKG